MEEHTVMTTEALAVSGGTPASVATTLNARLTTASRSSGCRSVSSPVAALTRTNSASDAADSGAPAPAAPVVRPLVATSE